MKKFFMMIAAVCALSLAAGAQNTTRNLDVRDFHGIDASFKFEVNVAEGPAYAVEVTYPTEIEQYLTMDVRGDLLRLECKSLTGRVSKILDDSTIKVSVKAPKLDYVKTAGSAVVNFLDRLVLGKTDVVISAAGSSKIYGLDVEGRDANIKTSGSSEVNITGVFDSMTVECTGASTLNINAFADKMNLKASGAAKINGSADIDECKFDVAGTTKLALTGIADDFRLESSGAATLTLDGFVADYMEVHMSGASKARVNATTKLFVDLGTSAKCDYKDNPGMQLEIAKPKNLNAF